MAKQPKQPSNQVRIIGGQYKRRLINFIDSDGLRPTPDRLRETLFNWLLADTLDAVVLDMCAGSGVLGLESLSRGAKQAVLIEPNIKQAQTLKQNATTLNIAPTALQLINDTAQNVLANPKKFALPQTFDLIFIDPPYALNLWQALLQALHTQKLYHDNSLIYIESDKPLSDCLNSDTLQLLDIKKHTKIGQIYAYLVQLM